MPTLAALTPASGATAVQDDTPVTIELTRLDSTDYVKVETTQADFAAGTLMGTTARVTNDLVLATVPSYLVDDFESDTVGAAPSGWSIWSGAGFTVETIDAQKALRRAASANEDMLKWGSPAAATDFEVLVDFNFQAKAAAGIVTRVSGTFGTSSARGILVNCDAVAGTVWPYYNSGSGWQAIGTAASFTFATGTWYRIRIRTVGTTIQARVWARTGSEPSTWLVDRTDSHVTSAGLLAVRGTVNAAIFFDNTTIIGAGTGGVYVASGSRVSPAYPLSTVGKFGTGFVEYDATLPTGTTLTLKISKDGTNWTTVASGDRIALWAEGADLSAASIYTKAELATTDTGQTPVLSEVRLRFMAQDPGLVEIDIDGVAFTVANGGLTYWNTTKVTAGPTIVNPYRQDMFYATARPWYAYGAKVATVLVKYAGSTISMTTFTMLDQRTYGASRLYSWWLPLVAGGTYDGNLTSDFWWFASTVESFLIRGEAYWYVQFPPDASADAYYWIAHYLEFDTPLDAIIGQPVTHDVPAAAVGNCWARSDTPTALVGQCWQRSDDAASAVIANQLPAHDEVLAVIVGLPFASDTPASAAAYEVNRDASLEVHVISVDEAAALAALGITVAR